MDPQCHTKATLVDLLDRVLEKGLVIHADLIVSVAGIPLIGINLKAALAGMETMVKYGMMKEWDARIRAQEHTKRQGEAASLVGGEAVLMKGLGGWYCREGLHPAWRYGHLYLTPERLFIYQHPFDRMLFEIPLRRISRLTTPETQIGDEGQDRELHLTMDDGRVEQLRCRDVARLRALLEPHTAGAGVVLAESVWQAIWQGASANGPSPLCEIVCEDG